jgi:hypothetical protein
MTTASIKPYSAMARLHLGCGESLSQLLPDEAPLQIQPVQVERRRQPRKPEAQPKHGGGK